MAALAEREGVAARALEFTILTAARTGEAIGAQWSEIDIKAKVWTIPAGRMKASKEHRVPLSDRAVEILQALPTGEGQPVRLHRAARKRLVEHGHGVSAQAHGARRHHRARVQVAASAIGPPSARVTPTMWLSRRWRTLSATRSKLPTGAVTCSEARQVDGRVVGVLHKSGTSRQGRAPEGREDAGVRRTNQNDFVQLVERIVASTEEAGEKTLKLKTSIVRELLELAKRAPKPRGRQRVSRYERMRETITLFRAGKRKKDLVTAGVSAEEAHYQAAEEAAANLPSRNLAPSTIARRMQRRRRH